MKDTLISYSTAELAHDKGFKIRCPNMFDRNKEIQTTPSIKQILSEGGTYKDIKTPIQIFAPTQSLLQKWLRDNHKIFVFSDSILDCTIHEKGIKRFYFNIDDIDSSDADNIELFDTYEKALEEGLYEALKLIKNE